MRRISPESLLAVIIRKVLGERAGTGRHAQRDVRARPDHTGGHNKNAIDQTRNTQDEMESVLMKDKGHRRAARLDREKNDKKKKHRKIKHRVDVHAERSKRQIRG